jgi:glucose/arabinose dehydrogenase
LEIYSTGTRNYLDLVINSEDEIFTYDNTDDGLGWWTRVTHMVDGGYYGYPFDYRPPESQPLALAEFRKHSDKPYKPYTLWRMDEFGGGAPTGGMSYNEDALPPEFVGNGFWCARAMSSDLSSSATRKPRPTRSPSAIAGWPAAAFGRWASR